MKGLILYGNNEIGITLIKNEESQHYTKQIDIQYYDIQELVNEGKLTVK